MAYVKLNKKIVQKDEKSKEFADGGMPAPDTTYLRISVALTPDQPISADQLPAILSLLDDATIEPFNLARIPAIAQDPTLGYKLLALRLARQLRTEWTDAGWTPVGEGQPDVGTEYLVLLHDGSMVNDWWEVSPEGQGRFQYSHYHSKVTHYRPILDRPLPTFGDE